MHALVRHPMFKAMAADCPRWLVCGDSIQVSTTRPSGPGLGHDGGMSSTPTKVTEDLDEDLDGSRR